MLSRRNYFKALAAGLGEQAIASVLPSSVSTSSSPSISGGPKRVVFFLQNQGFDPKTCIPSGMVNSGSLANKKLPLPIQALDPFREKMHIINGLHGRHTSPAHSAFFGALGGYRGSDGVPPLASTVDLSLIHI